MERFPALCVPFPLHTAGIQDRFSRHWTQMNESPSHDIPLRPGECIDPFMDGRLRLIQSRLGYRFSIDAILLSGFATVKTGDVVLDLGTGCGVIPLMLLSTAPVGHAFGLEIQKELGDQAARNADLNGYGNRLHIVRGDIACPPFRGSSVDVVTCNPPYRAAKSGRINPDPRRAIARHELLTSSEDIVRTSAYLLRKKGRLSMIYPSERLADLFVRMRRANLEPKRVRIVYPDMQSPAKLALVEAALGGRPGLRVEPPLLGQGAFSL